MALPVLAGLMMFGIGSPSSAVAQGSADDPAQVTAGKAVYEMNCAGCHADDGTGVAGRGRPLVGVAAQADRSQHLTSVSEGLGGMPAFGERLEAEEVEEAVSYVRLTFVAAEEPVDEEPAEEDAAAEEEEPAEEDEAAASSSDGETELALTGASTGELAAIGLTMVVAGAGILRVSRRRS